MLTFSASPPPIPQAPPSSLESSQNGGKFIPWEKQPLGWVTSLILTLCCTLLFLSQYTVLSQKIPEKFSELSLFTSPVDKALLFDYPEFYQLLDRFISVYGFEALAPHADIPPSGKRLLEKIQTTPYWKGIYPLLLKGGWEDVQEELRSTPLFEKIREGEEWRFITPCFLHADLFHLLFNMLWLFVLGKQIEQRIKATRYLFFIFIIGAFSNTAQYLISGPNFIGFSGVLCGMLTFIWMRQKNTAWEGYRIEKTTLLFMFIYILGMAAIQLLAFFFERSFDLAFSPNIANMAHLSGGFAGYLLGKINFFSWRHG